MNRNSHLDVRLAHFTEVCREQGVKLTPQRLEIFKEVAQAGDHPDAEQVFQRVRQRLPTVSLDTVYRTLWLLGELGLVRTLGVSRERTRFDANLDRHHHFVCSRCGATRDFYSDELDNVALPDVLHHYGEIVATHVEVRGICRDCLGEKG